MSNADAAAAARQSPHPLASLSGDTLLADEQYPLARC